MTARELTTIGAGMHTRGRRSGVGRGGCAAVARRAGRGGADGFSDLETLEARRLFVADPVSVVHPTWFANYGAVAVDGVMDAGEWADSVPVVRTQGNRVDSSVTMRVKYTELGLYIGLDVKDQYLWADGGGNGSGSSYDWFNDDSMALYFDASNTRKQYMTPAGRALSFNIGAPNGPTSGGGAVTRYNYIRGNNPTGIDGDLYGVHVNPWGALSAGMTWKTVYHGTVNNNSDLDEGWTTEVFLPWASINMGGMPVNGQSITMNFSVLLDDTGGARNATDYSQSADPSMRFGPRTLDDQIDGVPSSFNVSMPGMQGPVGYAWLVFTDPRANDRPNPVIQLGVDGVDGYSARLRFIAPAAGQNCFVLGPAKRGGVYQYAIRWSETPFADEGDWDTGTEVVNTFTPHPRGIKDAVRIGQLEPGTQYYVAIRTVDTAGRMSDIQQVSFTTQTELQDPTGGQRLMPSPAGGGLVTEGLGEAFTMVASSIIPNNLYVRNAYPGDGWNANAGTYVNYTQTPGGEGGVGGYFAALADSGVNTLRVTMEWLATAAPGALPGVRGSYWIESRPGVYNDDMRQWLLTLMGEASRNGIRLMLKPFDTFNYRAYFDMTAFSTANGGPISTIDDFFQSNGVMNMVVNRMKTIIDWVNSSPDAASVIGIQLPNEWDNWSWTLNPRGNGDPSRTQEMRDRSKYILREAAAVKAYAPNMLVVSTTDGLVPRGPAARALFLGDNLDILAPHLYTSTTAEPVNSPDADKSVRPVSDYAALAGYWMTNTRDNRALFNGEWGLVKWLWDTNRVYYTGVSPNPNPAKPWTVQNDVDLYRTTTWTQIAMGMAGSGNRLAGQEMRDLLPDNIGPGTTGYLPAPLPAQMRGIQGTVAAFASDWGVGFDAGNYRALPLAGRVSFGGTGKRLIGVGSSDGLQGMVYVMQDLNRTSGNVPSATLNVDGLRDGVYMDVEFWSTDEGGSQIGMAFSVEVVNGRLSVVLPAFAKDVMVRFKGWGG
ncbi:MAG TPA: hypothetical protein PKE29_17625 [Phycisphaerales bacterium]|nr:hypothetical protein [Phycisphaerales bacterium]